MDIVTARISPNFANTQDLEYNWIYVYPSYLDGCNRSRAARIARRWGATGNGEGRQGQTYAIPIKENKYDLVSQDDFKLYVNNFKEYALNNTELFFMCSPAGISPGEFDYGFVADVFESLAEMENVFLSKHIWEEIHKKSSKYLEGMKTIFTGFKFYAGKKVLYKISKTDKWKEGLCIKAGNFMGVQGAQIMDIKSSTNFYLYNLNFIKIHA